MKINSKVIQRIVAFVLFLTGLIFAILGIFGVNVTVNQEDINNIIFGLGAVIAAAIEFVPLLYSLIKDKNARELLAIVKDIVYAVEELKGLTGAEKKQKALDSIKEVCESRGIEFDAERVDDMIESVIAIYNLVIKNQKLK